MAKLLEMPKLSPTMEEGVLSAWHKQEGDAVEVDDLLAEVETDKATMEFRAFDKGTLLKILVAPGTNVKLGDPVAILGNAGDDVTALLAKAGAEGGDAAAATATAAKTEAHGPDTQAAVAPAAAAAAPAPVAAAPVAAPAAPAGAARPAQPATPRGSILTRTERSPFTSGGGGVQLVANGGTNGSGRVLASPFVRKAARDRGLDLALAHGSGPGGRVLPADLDQIRPPAAPEASTALARAPSPGSAASSGLSAPEVRRALPDAQDDRAPAERVEANGAALLPHHRRRRGEARGAARADQRRARQRGCGQARRRGRGGQAVQGERERPAAQGGRRRARAGAGVQRAVHRGGDPHPQPHRRLGRRGGARGAGDAGGAQRRSQERGGDRPRGARAGGARPARRSSSPRR